MVSLEEVIEQYIFKKVAVKLTTGAELEGYIVDLKLPIATTIAWHFLEEFKAKRYLAKFNPDWLTPLPNNLIEAIKIIEEYTEVEEALRNKRLEMF